MLIPIRVGWIAVPQVIGIAIDELRNEQGSRGYSKRDGGLSKIGDVGIKM